jgi:hypothetical protein
VEQFRELAFDRDEAQAWNMAGQELDKDVHIAVGREVVAQHGPKQRQAGDMVPPAERRHGLPIDGQVWTDRLASGVYDSAIPISLRVSVLRNDDSPTRRHKICWMRSRSELLSSALFAEGNLGVHQGKGKKSVHRQNSKPP